MELDWYDLRGAGWKGTQPGWYEHIIVFNNIHDGDTVHENIVYWLYDTIDKPERHARWARFPGSMKIKFRYERDYLLFLLRWA